MRDLLLALVQGALEVAAWILARTLPKTRTVVVSGFPATEGNAVETARALVERYEGTVVWLQEGEVVPAQVRALDPRRLRVVAKPSLAGLMAYARAEAVFFTHGLYGSPRPPAGKPVVNLWHGDGPKDVRPGRDTGGQIRSSYFVGNTRLFSEFQARALGVPSRRVLVTGNPRTDQLWDPPSRAALERLGITGDYVLWMPTFRQARAVGAVRTRIGAGGGLDQERELTALSEGLRARGLQLVVKPHPMDAEERLREGAVTVTDADLARAGVTLYGLLGAARGLVTDYSSVWVDFLLTDRPMAFLVPDRASYARSLYPADVLEWLPGEVVDGERAPFAAFLADLDAGGAEGAALRAEVAHRIGLNPTRTAAADLVDRLVVAGVLPEPTGAGGGSASLRGRRNGRSSHR